VTTASSCVRGTVRHAAAHPDFKVRHGLDAAALPQLFSLERGAVRGRMRGSAIYRIGYQRWSRISAVALVTPRPRRM